MKKSLTVIVFVSLQIISFLSDAKTLKKPDVGLHYLNSSFSQYDSIQKQVFDWAELGFKEYKSSEALASHLESNGFEVERGVAGMPTAFVASFGSGKPVIGILGEYDALPGMRQDTSAYNHSDKPGCPGHGCGHNLIGTGSAAAAVAISKYLSEGHKGTVRYYGCPAEEGGGGKIYMTDKGLFDDCDAVFDWHPDTENYVGLTPGLANVRVNFIFHGISSHASVAPQNGRSALDALEAFNYMMNLMREHVPYQTRIHYIITNGGQSANSVPERAQAVYYIRHTEVDVVRDVLARAIKAAEGAAMGTGTKAEYEIVGGNYPRLINRQLADVFLENLVKAGGIELSVSEREYAGQILKNSGKDNPELISKMESVDSVIRPAKEFGPSSDVGNVSQVAPLANLRIATCVSAGGTHSWQQASMSGTTIGTKAMLKAAEVFYLSAVELYSHPEKLKAIRKEYEKIQGKDFRFVPLVGDRHPPLDYTDNQ